ncbi:MAG: NUDIX hydrolase [Gammaproteobacteria bacterium]|nr:NUDIX hydrolase [Gammaproteobacteria bacterium]
MTWKPHFTVAAIIEKDEKFLMVEEYINDIKVLNQPAGHVEPNETAFNAVIRETLEETAWHFDPEYLIGVYQWQNTARDTFLRFVFGGRCISHDPDRSLDPDIYQALWMDYDQINSDDVTVRSPMVIRSIQDYMRGQQYPLNLITELQS